MNMSAGELLSRTHEELVLLLIQLRRKSANTCNAIDGCYNEIDKLQVCLLKVFYFLGANTTNLQNC